MDIRIFHIRRALIIKCANGELTRVESRPVRATYCGAYESSIDVNPRSIRGPYLALADLRRAPYGAEWRTELCRSCFQALHRERRRARNELVDNSGFPCWGRVVVVDALSDSCYVEPTT